MRVLHIVSSLNPNEGGISEGLRNTVLEFSRKGINMEIVSCDSFNEAAAWKDNFTFYSLGPGLTNWKYSTKVALFLNKNLKNYDVIIVNGLWQFPSFFTYIVILGLRRKGINKPIFYIMPHGMLDPWFQRSKSRRLKAFRNKIYWFLIERQVVNKANGILFTCQQELELARTTFWGYKPQREINVGYGILAPPKCNDSIIRSFNHSRPYLLFLSRIHEKKGVDILINVYQQLRNDCLDLSFPDLVIAGPGLESEYGQKVLELVEDKYKESISFVGMLTGEVKWGAIYGCEAFILPSHQENFGIAVVEALACGKSVIISNQVNIWQEVMSEGAGLICSDDNNGFKEILKKWLSLSVNDKLEMQKNAIRCFEKYFTIEGYANRVEQEL